MGDRGIYCAGPEDDPAIKYFDSSNDDAWNVTETVVNDMSLDGIFDNGEQILYGTAPTAGTPLEDDFQIFYTDTDNYGYWDPGESVVYDADGDGIYGSGDTVIYGSTPIDGWPLFRSAPAVSIDDEERCMDRNLGLSHNKTWIILIWFALTPPQCGLF